MKSSTRSVIDSFRDKAKDLQKSSADIAKLLREGYDPAIASSTAEKLFNSDTVRFITIDGTVGRDEQLDMLIFYAGAFAYEGTLKATRTGCVTREELPSSATACVSTAIPIYDEDLSRVSSDVTESGVEIDPARLPNALMHLSEYYLAVKRLLERDYEVKAVILDRTLAGDVGHLVWSVKERLDNSVLLGVGTPRGRVTRLDLELARMLHPNPQLGIPTPRSHLLKYAVLYALMGRREALNPAEVLDATGASRDRAGKVAKVLRETHMDYDPFTSEMGYRLKPGVEAYWERVFSAAMAVSEHVFNTPEGKHPLIYEKDGGKYWITADDMAYLTLIMIYKLLRLAWEENVLVLGVIKDCSSAELVKTVVPILENAGALKMSGPLPAFNSDKMLLQTHSVINCRECRSPWRTFEFDACFRTMVPDEDLTLNSGEARVRGAFKNVISAERLFVKSYVQLWQSSSDPSVRSHVFSYDRPCYPGFDEPGELLLLHADGGVDEVIEPMIHFAKESEITHLVMAVLHSMALETIPEALGHSYPLFLADKKAKAVLESMRATYLSTVSLEITNSSLDQQILFNSRFRDYRSDIESKRRGIA